MIAPRVKALFHSLVRLSGGVEASAAVLGVSHQRVSQLQSMNCADLPTLTQVHTLEMFCGQPVVTGALAKTVSEAVVATDPLKEACEVTEQAAELLRMVRTKAPQSEIRAAIQRLHRETDEVTAALPG